VLSSQLLCSTDPTELSLSIGVWRFCRITRLGKTVGQIQNLQQLSLAGNQITDLPPAIGNLAHLKMLQMSDNFLRKLPNEIRKLTSLEYLDVTNNQISSLPQIVDQVVSLKVLRAGNNKLTFIPPELCFCTQLRELHLRKNKIVNVQGNIFQWTQLVIADLGENNLQFCPIEIGRLPELQEVMLDGNAKLRIPPQVTDGGTASVVAYLQTLGEQHRLIDAHLERFTFAQLSRTELEAAILGEDDEPEPEEAEAVEGAARDLLGNEGLENADVRPKPPPPETPARVEMQLAASNALGQANRHAREARMSMAETITSKAMSKHGAGGGGGMVEYEGGAAGVGGGVVAVYDPVKEAAKMAAAVETQRIKDRLMANPKLKKIAFETRREKQRTMRETVEQTRRLLAQKEIDYGNVFVRQLARARKSGVCNLKTCNLRAIPPEVGELQQTRVMDLRDNKLDRLTDKVRA